MQKELKELVIKLLLETAEKIKDGRCALTNEQAGAIVSVFSHNILSKAQACEYLNLSRSRFDDYVRLGTIPKSKPCKGFKELIWYEDELNDAILKLNR